MKPFVNPLSDAKTLVVDGNPQSRSIVVNQLRGAGVGTIVQVSRLVDARTKLEMGSYDVVLCEQYFERDNHTGQDLLDDLRRHQLLPFYTVFVMITSDASYSKVAEAAESALDVYLLKPHTAAGLVERIQQARDRKAALKDIFVAIDREAYQEAADMCQQHFDAQKPYWLYAARIGAELMLRSGQVDQAETLYKAVVNAKTLPWARLGVARAQLEAGETERAVTTLESLIETDPGYTDAYDIMGRAQFELGNFDSALNTFKMSTQLTPSSVNRLLKCGMMTWYVGDREDGTQLLDRATRIGLDSKLYDPQALVLMAFTRMDAGEHRNLQRCLENLEYLVGREAPNPRLDRLLDVVRALIHIHEYQTARALEEMRRMAKTIHLPSFTFEAASNLLGLMTRLAMRSIQLYEVDAAVDTLGLRFCSSRALTELMAASASGRNDFIYRIRAAYNQIQKISEAANTLCQQGDPQAAVEHLVAEGQRTLNARLIEAAHQILQAHEADIVEHTALNKQTVELRELYRTADIHSGLGEHVNTGRAAGGLSLPSGYKPPDTEGLLSKVEAV